MKNQDDGFFVFNHLLSPISGEWRFTGNRVIGMLFNSG